jgi:hypothetical protein
VPGKPLPVSCQFPRSIANGGITLNSQPFPNKSIDITISKKDHFSSFPPGGTGSLPASVFELYLKHGLIPLKLHKTVAPDYFGTKTLANKLPVPPLIGKWLLGSLCATFTSSDDIFICLTATWQLESKQ